MKFERQSKEFEMFGALYRLTEKYYQGGALDDEPYWTELEKDALSFMGRFEEVPLARRLCLALLAYLDDQARGEP